MWSRLQCKLKWNVMDGGQVCHWVCVRVLFAAHLTWLRQETPSRTTQTSALLSLVTAVNRKTRTPSNY